MYNSLKPINIYTSERLPSQIYGIARRPESWRPCLLQEGRLALPAPLVCDFLGSLTQSGCCCQPREFLCRLSLLPRGCRGVARVWAQRGAQLLCSSGPKQALPEGQTLLGPYLVAQTRSPMHGWKLGFSMCVPLCSSAFGLGGWLCLKMC